MRAPTVTITDWKPAPRKTRVGFVDLRFPEIGLTIRSCSVHRFTSFAGETTDWLSYPAAAYFDSEGQRRDFATIFFTRHIHQAIADNVFAQLKRTAPEIFAAKKVQAA